MIADYGRAYLDAATSCTNSTNNSAWTAPEFFSIKEFDLKNVLTKSADSWSMAVTILEVSLLHVHDCGLSLLTFLLCVRYTVERKTYGEESDSTVNSELWEKD